MPHRGAPSRDSDAAAPGAVDLAAAALVFLFCTTGYGVIMVLGNGRVRTVERRSTPRGVGYFGSRGRGISVVQIVVVVATLVVARLLLGACRGPAGRAGPLRIVPAASRREAGGRRRAAVWLTLAWTGLWLVLPLAVSPCGRCAQPDRAAGRWRGIARWGRRQRHHPDVLGDSLGDHRGTAAVLAFVLGLNLAVVLTRIRGRCGPSPTLSRPSRSA